MKQELLKEVQTLELEILDEIVNICNKYNINYFFIAGTLIGAVRHKRFIPWDDDLDIAMFRNDYDRFIEVAQKELSDRFIIDSHDTTNYYRLAAKVRIKNTIYMQEDLKNYQGEQGIWVDILPLDNVKKQKSILLSIQATLKSILEITIERKRKIDISYKSFFKRSIAFLLSIFPCSLLIKWQTNIMKMQNNNSNQFVVNLASKYNYKKQTFKKDVWVPNTTLEFEGKEYSVPGKYDIVLKQVYGDYMKIPPKEKQEIHNPIKIKFEDGREFAYEEI